MQFRNGIPLKKWIRFEKIGYVLTIYILAIHNYFLDIFSLEKWKNIVNKAGKQVFFLFF
jgi:hypothetical protein